MSNPLEFENLALRHDLEEVMWMARRYADGRQTYAVNMYNEIALNCLRIGIKLNTCDGIVWARDGGGREFDGLSEARAIPGTKEALGEIF